MIKRATRLVLLVLFGVLPKSVLSQDAYAERLLAQYSSGCKSAINAVLEKLGGQIALHPKLARRNDLVLFVPSADYVAITDFSLQRVMIPVAWCIETWLTAEALTEITKRPEMTEALREYSKYLSVRQRVFRMTGSQFNKALLVTFHDFTGLPRPSLTTPEAEQYIKAQESVLTDALSFVIAHELGHLVLDHRPHQQVTSQISRRQEYAADEFAIHMLRDSGIPLLGALVATERFLTDEQPGPPNAGTHPTGECRIERIFRLGALPEVQKANETGRRVLTQLKKLDVEDLVKRLSAIRLQCDKDEN